MKSNSLKSGESILFVFCPALNWPYIHFSQKKFMAQIWWSDCKLLEHMHKSIAALLRGGGVSATASPSPPPPSTCFGKNRPYLWPKIIIITSNPHFKSSIGIYAMIYWNWPLKIDGSAIFCAAHYYTHALLLQLDLSLLCRLQIYLYIMLHLLLFFLLFFCCFLIVSYIRSRDLAPCTIAQLSHK